jgi:hypothetical protein
MKIWQIGALLCVGLGATVACSDEEGSTAGSAGTGGRAGSSGAGSSNGGTSGHGGSVGGGGKNGSDGGMAGEGGTSNAGAAGDGGDSSASGGAAGDGGMGGMGGAGGADGGPADPLAHCSGCTRTKIGLPKWELSGIVAVPSDMPSQEGYLEFLDDLTGPNHAFDMNDGIIGPGAVHAGPYDDELYLLAVAKDIPVKQSFTTEEFSDPSGVTIMMNIIPSEGAVTGSSVDFASGPIIPNTLFPFTVDGDMYREGVLYDPYFDGTYAGYPAMTPPIEKDGPSHFVWFFGENSAFGPEGTPATGSFEFKLKMTDKNGNGWYLTVPYTVTD